MVCVDSDVITRDGFGFGLVSCPLCHTYNMYIHRLNDLASLSFLPPFLLFCDLSLRNFCLSVFTSALSKLCSFIIIPLASIF